MRERAEDDEGEDEEAEVGRRREELTGVVLDAGVQTLRDAVLGLRLAGPAEGRASSAVLRPYICSPLGVGLGEAKGRAVR